MKRVSLFRYLVPLSTVGIGSVPFQRGRNSCKDIFKDWDIPFWPQYPRRSLKENFIFQFLSSFPGLKVGEQSASFDESIYRRHQKSFREKLQAAFRSGDLSEFEPASSWALGYSQLKRLLEKKSFLEKRVIKLQITGPGTIWNSFFARRASQDQVRQIQKDLCLNLLASGLAQVQRILSYKRIPLIFVDEPIPGESLSFLRTLMTSLRRGGAFVGLHVCSFQNWGRLKTLPADLIHFDLSSFKNFSGSQRRFLRNFLKRGGGIVWGAISTSGDFNFHTRDFSSLLSDQIEKVWASEKETRRTIQRSLIAPACGTGTLTVAQHQMILESLRETVRGLRAWLDGNK